MSLPDTLGQCSNNFPGGRRKVKLINIPASKRDATGNFLVAEYIKSKMTRERDVGQVNFIDEGFESAADLLVKKTAPTEDSTCCVRNSRQNSVRLRQMRKSFPSVVLGNNNPNGKKKAESKNTQDTKKCA